MADEEEPPAWLARVLRRAIESGAFWEGQYVLALSGLQMNCTRGLCNVTIYRDAAEYLKHMLGFHRLSLEDFAAEIEERMSKPGIVVKKSPTWGRTFALKEKK
jgi:hypothetical protein